MMFEDLPPMQQAVILQALYKSIAEKVSTKNPDSLRSQVDAEVLGWYEATGAKSYDVSIAGSKVGTYSVTVAKETRKTAFDLTDGVAFATWLASEDGIDAAREYAYQQGEKFVDWCVKETGAVPDGVEARTVTIPEHAKGTTIRVDPRLVASALGKELPSAVAGLLEGGAR